MHTEYVENVVPSILYKTKHEHLVETSIVTDVVQSIITVTHTKSVPVTQYSSVTEVRRKKPLKLLSGTPSSLQTISPN